MSKHPQTRENLDLDPDLGDHRPMHPVVSEPPSHRAAGVWVRHKRTDAVGYIAFTIKYRPYMDLPADVYVVWPPTPHNKKAASIKTFSGGVYQSEDLVKLNRKRKKVK